MSSTWHDTPSLYAKLLQIEHSFPEQTVMQPAGAGVGVLEVIVGDPNIHLVVREICNLGIVCQVAVGENYLLIVVDRPQYWDRFLGEIQHIVARHI